MLLFVDSTDGIEVRPEPGYEEKGQKLQSDHRTLSGAGYCYRWGAFQAFKFQVSFVSSSDKTFINSAWLLNSPLWLTESGSGIKYRVRVTNKAQPVGGYVKPHLDLTKGGIQLEQFASGYSERYHVYPPACTGDDWATGDYGLVTAAVNSSYDAGSITDIASACLRDYGYIV